MKYSFRRETDLGATFLFAPLRLFFFRTARRTVRRTGSSTVWGTDKLSKLRSLFFLLILFMTTSHGGVSSTEMAAVNKRGKKSQKSLPALREKTKKTNKLRCYYKTSCGTDSHPETATQKKSNEPHRTGTIRKKKQDKKRKQGKEKRKKKCNNSRP